MVLRIVTPSSLVGVYWRFGGTYHPHLWSKIKDGDSMFIRNVRKQLLDHIALWPRGPYSTVNIAFSNVYLLPYARSWNCASLGIGLRTVWRCFAIDSCYINISRRCAGLSRCCRLLNDCFFLFYFCNFLISCTPSILFWCTLYILTKFVINCDL